MEERVNRLLTNIDNLPRVRNSKGQFEPKFTGTKAASTATVPSELAELVMSDEDEFLARNPVRDVTTMEVFEEAGGDIHKVGGVDESDIKAIRSTRPWGTALVTHRRSDRKILYKKTDVGWEPRTVASTAVAGLIEAGFAVKCQDCHGHHGAEANDCPARPRVKFAICDICGLKMYDMYQQTPAAIEAYNKAQRDENLIVFNEQENSTPESRLRVALNEHTLWKHPRTAKERQIAIPDQSQADSMAEAAASMRS